MISRRQAIGLGPIAWLLLLTGGCATRPLLLPPTAPGAELAQTPFFPQDRYQCGPAALATVLGASGVIVTPQRLEPLVYLPGRKGSLAIEMQAVPRQFGRIAYRIEPELGAITAEVDAVRPVLVLHNYGLPFWPRWHYAVVIGHEPARQRLLLRSGRVAREAWSARQFMRAWDNGDRWAIVMLQPGELPVAPDKSRYLEAAAAFESRATPEQARLTFDAAVRHWPDEPLALIGRGTAHYLAQDYRPAISDYRAALALDGSRAAARNNLAMALLQAGCADEARRELDRLGDAPLAGALQEAVADTRRQLQGRTDTPACRVAMP